MNKRGNMFQKIQNLILFLIFSMAVVQFITTNSLVVFNGEVYANDVKLDNIDEENSILERQLAEATSLKTISEKATELGFVVPESVISVSADLPVAVRP